MSESFTSIGMLCLVTSCCKQLPAAVPSTSKVFRHFLPLSQKDDLRAVVEYLRTDGNVSLIGLWGRSMGAVTR